MPVVLVVQHEDLCPLDRLEGWLAARGVAPVWCRPYAGDAVPATVAEDGLIVLGGHMGANDDAAYPWLPRVRALLANSVGDATPTLGVCLGAQLLAVACGGRVEVGAAGLEAGVLDVRLRPAAADDPLLSGLPDPLGVPSMHGDAVVELPPDAVWLAASPTYPHQAFRVGGAAWGVQFHPEVSPATYRTWAAGHAAEWAAAGVDGAAVVAQLTRREDEVTAVGRALADRFAGLLGADGVYAGPAGR